MISCLVQEKKNPHTELHIFPVFLDVNLNSQKELLLVGFLIVFIIIDSLFGLSNETKI